jgi:hypothetical protein
MAVSIPEAQKRPPSLRTCQHFRFRVAEQPLGSGIPGGKVPFRVEHENGVFPDGFDHQAEAFLGVHQRLRPFDHLFLHLQGLLGDEAALQVQIHEDGDLGPEDLRPDRGKDVIHGAQGVPVGQIHVRRAEGADEEDGDLFRSRKIPDPARRREPVHSGHQHVEEYDGEFPFGKPTQALLSRGGPEYFQIQPIQGRGQGFGLVAIVVDDQQGNPRCRPRVIMHSKPLD